MSVVGIDVGNQSILIAQAGKGGVDLILNESSNRQTPTFVAVQGKQRFYGDAALSMSRSNIYNTFSQLKALIGRKFDSPKVQQELSQVPFRTVKLSHGGVGVVVSYDNKEVVVPAEQIFAMLLLRAKEIGFLANNGINVADAVLAVPYWYTDSQRRAVLVASEIANLNTLKVVNESTAIALSYGIFKSAKKLFSETEPVHIMFIDLGYTGYSVSIVDFVQENMRVLSTVCDASVGGRDFDNAIVDFLVESFKTKTGIDVSKNIKATLKLQAAAEKAKKTLSPSGVGEANVSVECLAEDRDLNVTLTREEFEGRIAHLIAKLAGPVEKALVEAGLSKKDINEIEIVGGSTRVNMVKKFLGDVLQLDPAAMNYGLKTTMNSDEAVARGAALQAAIVSSRMKVKPFNIIDKIPYGIVVYFDNPSETYSCPDDGEGKEDVVKGTSAQLYKRGDDVPHQPKRLKFSNKNASFSLKVAYDEESSNILPDGEDTQIAQFTVRIPPDLVSTGPKDVRVTFDFDRNGLVGIVNAQLFEEFFEEGKDTETSESKKKYRKHDLDVISNVFSLSREQIKSAIELEAAWANEDRLIRETADKRNELESYIYSMRTKLDTSLKSYVTTADKNEFQTVLSDAEEWLYNDGFESTKQQYGRKIDELKSFGDKIEFRQTEENVRSSFVDALKKQVEMLKSFAANYDKDHDHITEEERGKVRIEAEKTESWLYDLLSKQADVPQHADPVLLSSDIKKKKQDLFNATNPITSKPKPKPVPAPTPATPSETESKDSKEGEPMDTGV